MVRSSSQVGGTEEKGKTTVIQGVSNTDHSGIWKSIMHKIGTDGAWERRDVFWLYKFLSQNFLTFLQLSWCVYLTLFLTLYRLFLRFVEFSTFYRIFSRLIKYFSHLWHFSTFFSSLSCCVGLLKVGDYTMQGSC